MEPTVSKTTVSDQVAATPCPHCKAGPGEECRTPKGAYYMWTHQKRQKAALRGWFDEHGVQLTPLPGWERVWVPYSEREV